MQTNDHDLIMQFARGTEALNLFTQLDLCESDFRARKHVIDERYAKDIQRLQEECLQIALSAVSRTRGMLEDLTPAVTGPADDDYDDD